MTLVTGPSEEQEARAEMTPGCKAEMYDHGAGPRPRPGPLIGRSR